ncbi:CMRF35-like molecule 5 isoform X2 [Erinaceus europaeus]|uniref:CMRF35-like molecule 5 isoform X2 n=1 Tax=Erinaceus europaeus TaxID=9365 RepID=A0ABM3YC82_ERIEU|nr:CMRF35-like molecule 5 isoform X2 [Erinaceus europaeus]
MERNQVGRTLWLPPLSLLLLLPGCFAISGPGIVIGTVRGTMTILCHYNSGWESYSKWWCRGSDWSSCNILIKTGGSEQKVKEGRVSIQDNHQWRSLTVTIEDLRKEDEDAYWCGIERSGTDLGHKVILSVHPATPTTFLPKPVTTSYGKAYSSKHRTTATDAPGTTDATEPKTIDTKAWLNSSALITQDTNSSLAVTSPLVRVLVCNMHFLLLTGMKVPLLVLLCSVWCLKRRSRVSREKQSQLEQVHHLCLALDTEWSPMIDEELYSDYYFEKRQR